MSAALAHRIGDAGVRQLAERAAHFVRVWGLHSAGEALEGGSWAYLLPCEDEIGREFVLKVSASAAATPREAAALEAWEASGCAAILARRARAALLLERVRPGGAFTGTENGARDALVSVLAQLQAASGEPEPDATPFVRHERDLLPVLARIRQRLETHVSRRRLERAIDMQATAVRTIRRTRLIHGDVSPGNILIGRGRLVAVDPAGVLGEPEYDAAGAAFYFDFGGAPAERVADLARVLDLDEGRTLAWARFHALQSASFAIALGDESAAEWTAEQLTFALSA